MFSFTLKEIPVCISIQSQQQMIQKSITSPLHLSLCLNLSHLLNCQLHELFDQHPPEQRYFAHHPIQFCMEPNYSLATKVPDTKA
mmetsp:Transcript_28237/g.43649  ORF Transcript_28237/g.43649 Transcript_28237/m.43649 type:complete len:85 (+) Transcript_28237:187-441(+)